MWWLWLVMMAAAGDGWTSIGDGLAHRTLTELDADLIRVDLDHHVVDVVLPGPSRPLTARALRLQARAAIAVNGGFFDTDGRSLGLRISAGKTRLGLRPRVDWGVLEIRDQRARIVHGRQWVADAAITAAIQVGPRVLIGGVVPGLKPQASRRTAIAIGDDPGQITFVITRGFTLARDLGTALAALGYRDAVLLDGGPSTQLSAKAGSWELEVPGGYAVPDLLLVQPRRAGVQR